MAAIGKLPGINSDEVTKLCQAGIGTIDEFVGHLNPNFNYGVFHISIKAGIKPDRVVQLIPPESLRPDVLPDVWLEGVVTRVLRKADPDDPWLKRCRLRLHDFGRGLRGNWCGWRENLPIVGLLLPLMLMLGLTLRAGGKLQWLPPPIGLRDQVLIIGRGIPSGKALEKADVFHVYLPLSDDYFQSHQTIEGLIASRSLSINSPLRFSDTLRQQVVAAKDLDSGTTIQKEDVKFVWTTYEPEAVVNPEDVYGRQLNQPLQKHKSILRQFVKPQ